MGHDNDGNPLFPVDPEQEIVHLFPDLGIQVSRGFIGQDHFRIQHQRPGHSHPLLLAPGELAGFMVKPVFKPQLDQNPFRRPSRLFQGPPLNQSGHQGIFQGAEFRKEMVELENKAYVAVAQLRQLTFRPIEKVLPFEKNFSFGGPI
jgi:hypothetical protein